MLTPGAVFAGYTIQRVLGRGGMGDVYLARHPRLPRADALKLMSEELSRNEVYRQRFNAEADLASQIQHDSVVRVYDRGVHDDGEDAGRLWLAMEYIDGRDLADILAGETRLPVDRAVGLVERVASGLDAIHAKGLLHRDVKPANILVTRDVQGTERGLLTDFGIARSAADSLGLTGVDDVVATLRYAAPEQFELRSADLDHRVDVYSLGCVLYEMLTGRVPLEATSVAAFWHVIQTETPVPPSRLAPGVSPQLDAVLAKALSKRRDDRYASAGELARAARAALNDASVPVALQPPTAAEGIVRTDPNLPFRIGLRRDEPGGARHFGPLYSERLPDADARRLSWLISTSNVLTLPSSLGGEWGPSTAMTAEVPGRFHTVAWTGQVPPVLSELAAEVERLAGSAAASTAQAPAAAAPAQPAHTGGHHPRRRRTRLLVAGAVAVVIVALAVTLPLLLLGGGKSTPGVPAALKAVPGRGTVTLTWQPGSGETDHYVVLRDGVPVAPSVIATTYIDRPADMATHRYAVQAVNSQRRTSPETPQQAVAAQIRELNVPEKALLARMTSALVYAPSCEPLTEGVDAKAQLGDHLRPRTGPDAEVARSRAAAAADLQHRQQHRSEGGARQRDQQPRRDVGQLLGGAAARHLELHRDSVRPQRQDHLLDGGRHVDAALVVRQAADLHPCADRQFVCEPAEMVAGRPAAPGFLTLCTPAPPARQPWERTCSDVGSRCRR